MDDEKDVVFQLRNSFYLGNYYKVLEMWKDYSKFEFKTHGTLVRSIIIRSLIKLGKNYTKYFENLDITPFKKDLPIFGKYLSPLTGKIDPETAAEVIKDFTSNIDKNYEYYGILIRLLWLATGDYENYAKNETNNVDLDVMNLQFYCYENMRRFDLSAKTLSSMKLKDEEDIATSLCNIHQLISTGKNKDAISAIDELKEKFEDSAKLNNLKAAVYIAQGNYEQAVAVLSKLCAILQNKEQFYDQSELETALVNLTVCAFYQGNNYDEHLKTLNELNPDHSFLKTLF